MAPQGIPTPTGTGHLTYQGHRVGFLEDIEPDTLGTVANRQARQLIAARDDDERTGTAGDQRTYLPDVGHVVEHDEHTTVGNARPEKRGPAVKVGRD